MKKVLLLLIFVAFAMFSGCSKSPIIENETNVINPNPTPANPVKEIEEYYGIEIHDKYNIQQARNSGAGDFIFIDGIRNNKHWSAVFNKNSKEQLMDYEYNSNIEPETNLQVQVGDIRNIIDRSFSGAYIIGENLYLNRRFIVTNESKETITLFTLMVYNIKNKSMIFYQPTRPFAESSYSIREWFENTVLARLFVKNNNKFIQHCTVFDLNHVELVNGITGVQPGEITSATPISLTKSIRFGVSSNLSQNASLWLYNIDKMETDSKKISFKNPYNNADDKFALGNISITNNLAHITLIITSAENTVTKKNIVFDINREEIKEILY